MLNKKLFGKNIEQKCSYCEKSDINSNGDVFCKIYRHFKPIGKCRKFRYDPLKRKPTVSPKLLKYDPKEFKL